MKMMKTEKKRIDVMWKYVMLSYILFWAMVMILGGSAAMLFNAPAGIQRAVQALCAWAPTFALLILFKKLRPQDSLKEFLRRAFAPALNPGLMVACGAAVVISSLLPVLILSRLEGNPFGSYFSLKGYSFVSTFLLCLFAGPLGEELGWRGYLRIELESKLGFLKASFLAGSIWAFWHAILWFVGVAFQGDAAGWPLVMYILSNVVVLTSLVIIMNVAMKKSGNLINAIWIHLCYNVVFYHLTNISVLYFVLLTGAYLITGILFLLVHYGIFSNLTHQAKKSCQ